MARKKRGKGKTSGPDSADRHPSAFTAITAVLAASAFPEVKNRVHAALIGQLDHTPPEDVVIGITNKVMEEVVEFIGKCLEGAARKSPELRSALAVLTNMIAGITEAMKTDALYKLPEIKVFQWRQEGCEDTDASPQSNGMRH